MSIIKLEKDPLEIKKNFLGKGASGSAYMLDNNEVYKEFYGPAYDKQTLLKLTKIKHTSFALPKQLIEVDDEVIGYIMDYVEGCDLKNLNENILFEDFLKDIKTFEQAIYELSNYYVVINDINLCNLIYTKEGFKAIDTDYYEFTNDDNVSRLYKNNLEDFNETILSCLIDFLTLDQLPSGIKSMYQMIVLYNVMPISKFLEEVKLILEGYYDRKISTISDFLSITKPKKESKSYGHR